MVYVALAVIVLLAVDWVIVMGTDPKKWKGGEKDGKR